jgi:hypothetical protein
MPVARTKTERQLEEAIAAHAGDPDRVLLLDRARRFKRSWIELAEVLVRAREDESWARWGFRSFDDYCARELHLRGGTVDKLCASFGYLRTHAPRLLRDDDDDLVRPVPTWQAVDFAARAEERGAAPVETLEEIRHAVFDEGAAAPALSRKFRDVAFPVAASERRARAREQLLAAARRVADLVADPEAGVPQKLAERVEALMGEVQQALGDARA